jgi:membrane-associated protease RseP (regulator of RpoE activity)
MLRSSLTVLAVLTLGLVQIWGQSPSPPQTTSELQGPYLGVLVSPVPEVLYDHLPLLPRQRGVVVNQVLPHSPAAVAELKRHDILLTYNGKPIEDPEHFARLIRADRPQQKVKLVLLRSGKELTSELTLGLGPLLTTPQNHRPDEKGTVKPEGPGKVSVAVTPLADQRMSVTIEYYDDGKLRALTRAGTSADIDREVAKLPPRVQELVRAALKRIRGLELEK